MAEVLPFPLARRRTLVARQAAWFVRQSEAAAEHNLARQLEVQRDALLRKGVGQAVVEAEVQALEGTIRATAWRLLLVPGGAA
jgi:hypothetical protein